MTCWVYILECRDGTFYTGHTHDLPQRLSRHTVGTGSRHIAQRGFLRLIYSEQLPSTEGAIQREMQIKRWSHAKKLALANNDMKQLKELSRSRN